MKTEQPRAVFRADASSTIGGGHVMRCLALVEALNNSGWHCSLACHVGTRETVAIPKKLELDIIDLEPGRDIDAICERKDSKIELMVVDHYQLDADYHRQCRTFTEKIFVIDELMNRQLDCDYLLDQSPGRNEKDYRDLVSDRCELMLGPGYALLRRGFAKQRQESMQRRQKCSEVSRLVISFGASDIHNLTLAALQATSLLKFKGSIDVVLGGGNKNVSKIETLISHMDADVVIHHDVANMEELMKQADLAIGGGGISAWERCTLALPALVVLEADNQLANVRGLQEAGAAQYMGLATEVNSKIIAEYLNDTLVDQSRLERMSVAAANLCDGNGVSRVIHRLLQ